MGEVRVQGSRKERADGRRNRALILDAAKRILSEKGEAASLDEIACEAGVGNGTLYRHFPTRNALIEAVCREDTHDLIEAATALALNYQPLDALRIWIEMFIEYLGTKRNIAESASALIAPAAGGPSSTDVKEALTILFSRAIDQREIGTVIDPLDLLRVVAGLGSIEPRQLWEESAKKLVGVILTGLPKVTASRSGAAS